MKHIYRQDYGLSREKVGNLKAWFAAYVEAFKSGDPDLRRNAILKEQHSLRVCDEIESIGKQLDLGPEELRLANIMALLHDVGRFEQFARHKTFVDARSVNHAELGVEILREKGVLNDLREDTRELVLRVILYHNRARLPVGESETCIFHARLLRDADKLDILRVVLDYYYRRDSERNAVIEYGLPDTPGVAEEVIGDLEAEGIVSIEHLRNLNDFKMLQLGWVFDINFLPTFLAIRERGYLEKLRGCLNEPGDVDGIFERVDARLEARIRENIII